MAARLLLALGLMAFAVAATGCGEQKARRAAEAARAAEQQAREEAMLAAKRAEQAKADADKEQKKAGLEAERLRQENEALRTQLADAQAQLADKQKPAGGTPQDTKRDNPTAPAKLTHLITAETPYNKPGPQQAQPPDGKFKTGAKVAIIREEGSYTLIRSEDGVEAYVATDALKPRAVEP